jgi:hypothetical protein
MLHNETINVWSHLVGVMLFIGVLIWTSFYLSPITGYLQTASEFSQVDYSQLTDDMVKESEQEVAFFENMCDRFLNVSLTSIQDETEAFIVWTKAWQQYEAL